MQEKIQSIRGMRDLLPAQSWRWQQVEALMCRLLQAYGYHEIRLPLLEQTSLFQRSIGEVTDIVEKEMYSFADRNGDQLTLRPEGTAGCVRAAIQHGLLQQVPQRLWYQGPMFRHERPQEGRYRQFYQLGVEVYGLAGPDIDLELILLSQRLWRHLGLEGVTLQLNSLGTLEERTQYRAQLLNYLQQHQEQLDEDSQRRLTTNPLRILDSKNPKMQSIIANAPSLLESLGSASRQHFAQLCAGLDAAGVAYQVNPTLVRGLDYYALTVFEWVTDALGAQGTICAGGRYDDLVVQLGGKPTPAIGFAIGLDRLITLLERQQLQVAEPLDAYLILVGKEAEQQGMVLAEQWRDAMPELRLQVHCGGGSFKSQFKKADRSDANYALILGENEMAKGTISVKPLRQDKPQMELSMIELKQMLTDLKKG